MFEIQFEKKKQDDRLCMGHFSICVVKLFYPTLQVNPVFPLLITSSEAADSNVGDGSRPVDNSA